MKRILMRFLMVLFIALSFSTLAPLSSLPASLEGEGKLARIYIDPCVGPENRVTRIYKEDHGSGHRLC